MKNFPIYILPVLICQFISVRVSFSQDFRTAINCSVIYDHLIIKEIPSYIQVPGGNYNIETEGVYTNYEPTIGMELGYQVEKGFYNSSVWVYSGLTLGYRRLDLTYVDENLYFLRTSNEQTEEVYFEASVKRNFLMVQIPIGMKFPIGKHLALGYSIRNNFVLKVKSTEKPNDASYQYKVDGMYRRSPTQYIPEVSGDIEYRIGHSAISLKYLYGLRPIYPEIQNSCNQIITGKMNFSSVMLSFSLGLENLFSGNDKGGTR